jgi:hypothetical protein
MYSQPHHANVPPVPENIQLPFYYNAYNDIARASFVAPRAQPIDVARAIWFYSVDNGHTTSCATVRKRATMSWSRRSLQPSTSIHSTAALAVRTSSSTSWMYVAISNFLQHFVSEGLFNPFPEEPHKSLNKVVWNGELLSTLCTLIDAALTH